MTDDLHHYYFIRQNKLVGISGKVTRSEAEKLAQGMVNDDPLHLPVTVALVLLTVQQATLPFEGDE